jgi:hypothetical protein
VPNDTQRDYLRNEWWFDIILKSRQHGFTTLKLIDALDRCIFIPNYSAGVIAHGLQEAMNIFRNKVQFAYTGCRRRSSEAVYPTHESKTELVLSNGSRIQVGTSMRGDTLQWLLITEFGKICAKYPEKAREIITGALNTVHVGQRVTIESTAEGQEGRFYEMTQDAEKQGARGPAAHAARLQVPLLSVVAWTGRIGSTPERADARDMRATSRSWSERTRTSGSMPSSARGTQEGRDAGCRHEA